VALMRRLGLEPDPWQVEVLEAGHPRLLLNCARQAGKSTAVALLGLAEAVFVPFTTVLLSRSARQSAELFRTVVGFYRRLGAPMPERLTAEELQLSNHSRIVSLPCREDTIRGYANVTLLVIDEAARVPDDLYRAVRPMLAVSNGRLICLSTPYGRRGFFWEAWARGGDDWARIEVAADRIPRIKPAFLAEERRTLGESWYRQEYECSFEALEGLVYPDFARCVVPAPPWRAGSRERPEDGRRVGGLDFGFRNPFAAVWGVLDRDGVLWLTGEHYARGKPLGYHAQHLPRDVLWYADPSGATERCELRCAGFAVREGNNALRPGIAAVSARLESGTLRVVEGCCPNLLAEAALYRYSDDPRDRRAEVPLDEYNHALAALRYLVSRLDARRMARTRPAGPPPDGAPPAAAPPPPPSQPPWWKRWDNPDLWARSGPANDATAGLPFRVVRVLRGSLLLWRRVMSVPIRNRIKGHRRVRAGDLLPHELNYRLHPELQRAALEALYRKVGFARSLLAS
jgi:hypothetical protein